MSARFPHPGLAAPALGTVRQEPFVMAEHIHLTPREIDAFRRLALSPADMVRVDESLTNCAECRQSASDRRLPPGAAPPFWEDEGWAEVEPLLRRRTRRGAAESEANHFSAAELADLLHAAAAGPGARHLSVCAECRARVADLCAFEHELRGDDPRVWAPAARPSHLARLLGWLAPVSTGATRHRTPRGAIAFGSLAATGATALVCYLAGLQPLRTDLARGRAELARARTEIAQAHAEAGQARAEAARRQEELGQLRPAHAQLQEQVGTLQNELRQVRDASEALQQENRRLRQTVHRPTPGDRRRPRPGAPAVQVLVRFPAGLDRLNLSDQLRGGSGASEGFTRMAPVKTFVLSDRPTFSWNPVTAATHYVVAVFDRNTQRQVVPDTRVAGTEWTPSQPLPRGRVLRWQVKAFRERHELATGPSPPAEVLFRILDAQSAEVLEAARQRAGGSTLALGERYAAAGLLDEAETVLREFLKTNPESELARQLLAAVVARR